VTDLEVLESNSCQ